MIYTGEALRAVAMPLGGLGTGNLAIRGDGALSQWQIVNRINHKGYVPHSFFGIQWRTKAGKSDSRALLSDAFWDDELTGVTPTTNDHLVPEGLREWAGPLPKSKVRAFDGRYPVAALEFDLGPDCPIALKLSAWSPLVPGNPDDSGWPVAVFDFDLANPTDSSITVRLLTTLQNIVGWDGISRIDGITNPGYGGNLNHTERIAGSSSVVMTNVALRDDDATQGQQALVAVGGEKVTLLPQWSRIDELWPRFRDNADIAQANHPGLSPAGQTWNAAAVIEVIVAPNSSQRVSVVHGWHFPNRYVDYDQWPPLIPKDKSRYYLGNHYALRGGLRESLGQFIDRLGELREKTFGYVEELYGQNLPAVVLDAAGSNIANLRTNVCMWTENGRFHGFEGGHGASTWMGECAHGGCCPMDCTHVWNYEQSLVALWPTLFRTMRDTGWNSNLHPIEGYLPHRTILPMAMPRLWNRTIGGPENPAIDGLFAEILKTYQDLRRTGDLYWVATVLPKIKASLRYLWRVHDDQGDGMIRGEQPNTYDIHLYGPNTYIGSQYLAALRAAEEILRRFDDADADECRRRFESGSRLYDETCWNGEYYVQRIPAGNTSPHQFGDGCVTDQLLGEFWAEELGLGPLLPEEHVRTALQAIFRRNFRTGFSGFVQSPRIYASEGDSGLLNATYEGTQRPEVPLLYSDEVWPGVEYLFAALSIRKGLVDQGLAVVTATRGRYDGRVRNPFNEVECGDHYIRSLAAWALLGACSAANV